VIVSRPFEVPVRALDALPFVAVVVFAAATVGTVVACVASTVVAAGEAVVPAVVAGVVVFEVLPTQPLTSSATIRIAASPQAIVPKVLRFSTMILLSKITCSIYTVIRRRLYITK
jgi:hypothetical protein